MSHQDTEQSAKKMKINPPVFYISALVILLIVGFAALFPQTADIHLKALQTSRRDGDRADVLRRRRAGDALSFPACRHTGNG